MSGEFDYYIDGVYKIPSLSNKEQEDLLECIRKGDEAAKKTLAESYLKVVADIAKEYSHFRFEDLAIEMLARGNDALVEAIDSYSREHGIPFHDYAESKVGKAIFDYCKDIFVDFHYDWDKFREDMALRDRHERRTRNEIKTERLLLRAIERNDVQDIYNNWANDPEVTKYLTWNAHENVDTTKAVVEAWLEDYKKHDTYRYGIELSGYDHLIGMIDIVGYIDDCPVIGYVLGKAFWNKGYMTEAFNAVIQDLFSKGFDKIFIEADERNYGSNRVIEKCGFSFSHKETKTCSESKPEIVTVNWYFRERTKEWLFNYICG